MGTADLGTGNFRKERCITTPYSLLPTPYSLKPRTFYLTQLRTAINYSYTSSNRQACTKF
ncbi:hypothetical protein [Moorena producens]|uniref:hypothetical protein n=1 Tax=Moorena producens TaxID=1155739 RepID=UPI003C7424CB